MGLFWQAAAGLMVAVVLWVILYGHSKEYAVALSICVCCLILIIAGRFIEPIVDLLNELQALGNLQPQWLNVMLKAAGIGLVVEIGSLICADAGNAALGKTMQILGAMTILWLAIPLMTGLVELIRQIVGDL